MMRIRLSSRAKRDLREIANYLATKNVVASQRVLSAINVAILQIADRRLAGQRLEHLRPGLRAFPAGPPAREYVVFYHFKDDALHVLTVLHGRRDWTGLFERGEI